MADSRLFMSPDFSTKFIEEYRKLPCLWKVRCSEYSNKWRRDEAWEHLVGITREKEVNADLNFVKKKVDNIRASFRKELRKIRESTQSGASSDDTYIPTLWYFELFKFTAEQEQPRQTMSNLNEGEENHLEEEVCIVEAEPNEDVNNADNEKLLYSESQTSSTKRKRISPKRTKRFSVEEEVRQRKALLEKASAVLNRPDEYDDLTKTYAAKFRRMPVSQRDIADKLINDILLKGLQNTLTNNHFISFCGYSAVPWHERDAASSYVTTTSNCSTPQLKIKPCFDSRFE
ncbi:uncharacterized protein LOC108669816 isoform X4 [Hyalella azteca]|uniref:Uncharacterized protein LOC108669816 isoform X4 n=1 Tax=Hyalella azteca TaxID=294128 RepID=A0A979FNH3_HYAAZ|nr:uncharacterized protein LOC108669816 isoform X4 [Hyalella azteca]